MKSPATRLVRAIGRWSLLALTVNSIIGLGVFGLPGTVGNLISVFCHHARSMASSFSLRSMPQR
jgi:amino acid transporter